MRPVTIITVLLILYFPVLSQQNQTISNIPVLEISDIEFADWNGNLVIEANESCNLSFVLKNSGEQPANNLRIKLTLLSPEDLNIKYRKSRIINSLKATKSQEVSFSIVAGDSIPDGQAIFRLEVIEANGFNAAPATIEFKTSQGNFVKNAPRPNMVSTKSQKGVSNLNLVGIQFIDNNENDILEAFETSQIQFRVFNNVDRYIDDVIVHFETNEGSSTGFSIRRGTLLGTFTPYEYRDVTISIKGNEDISEGLVSFSVYLIEAGQLKSAHQNFEIKTRKYTAPVLKIAKAEFSGQDGRELKKNEIFFLTMVLENTGTGTAYDIEVAPRLTNEHIRLIEPKLSISVDEIPGGESRELNFQFKSSKNNIFPNIPVILEVSENFNNLFLDSMVVASVVIPAEEMQAISEPARQNGNQVVEKEDHVPENDPENVKNNVAPSAVSTTPNLELHGVVFLDEDENDIINYKESCEIKFAINNSGSGLARDVTVIIKQLNKAISALSFQESITLGNLGPQQEVPVSIPIRSTGITSSDVAEFSIQIVEADGWDAARQSITVKTQELLEPGLLITSAEFFSESGQLMPNEGIELRVKVTNMGPGNAADIKVQFELPNDPNCFPLGDGNQEFALENLKIGDSKDFNISFITNRRYMTNQLPIKLDISESHRKYGIDTILVGEMNSTKTAGTTIEIQPRIIEQPIITEKPSVQQNEYPDQAENQVVQTRGGGDPLKGLGFEEAVKDMNIGLYFALIIGIDNYQGAWPPLQNAVHDARSVETMLRTKYKFDQFETLYNEMATEKNILKKMEWLIENVTENDNLLIFYSGHGTLNELINRGYWVPADAKTTETADLISNSEIQIYLRAIKSKHTLLISDACFSGDIFRGETLTFPLVRTERYYRQQHARPSRRAITSGSIEPVVDGGPEGHSVFSYFLLESLERNEDRFFDASQLFSDLKLPVFNSSDQTPIFRPIKNTGDQGGQFIFIRK